LTTKRAVLAYGILALALPIGAETALTVTSAVESALKNNITLQRSSLSLSGLKRRDDHSLNGLLPSLSVGAAAQLPLATLTPSVSGTVSASLSVSPALAASASKTRAQYQAGVLSLSAAERSVELSVRKAFYGLLYERENLAVLRNAIATAQKEYEQTLANWKAGRVPELDVLTAQVNVENQKPTLMAAEVTFESDLASFRQAIGLPARETIVLNGSLDDALGFTAVELASVAVSSPSVESLRQSLAVARASAAYARDAATLPKFSLSATYQPYLVSSGSVGYVGAGSVSASVSWPLDGFIPVSSAADTVADAADAVRDLELQLAKSEAEAADSIASLLRQIEQARSTLQARKLTVALAEKTYGLVEDAYKHGSKDLLSLQDAGDSRDAAKVALMKQSYTLIAALLDLEYATGVPFGTLGRNQK